MVALNFSARNVKPNTALEPIPTGNYPVMIVRSEEKPSKKGGSYIELEMQVQASPHIDPAYHGRKVFDRLNIVNANQTAVDIAYATLSAICHVTGVLDMTDTQQLHGRPFVAVVKKLPRDDQPDTMTNEVKGYKDMMGNDPGFSGTTQGGGQQPNWAQQGNNAPTQPAQTQQVQQPAQTQQVQQPVQEQAPAGAAPSWAGAQPVQTEQAPAQQQQAAPAEQAPASAAPSWAQSK